MLLNQGGLTDDGIENMVLPTEKCCANDKKQPEKTIN